MPSRIRSTAVLGAGTMGAQIAAHFANAGLPVLLLDVTPQAARDGFERARALKPDPFFVPSARALVRTGGFDEDLDSLRNCDWIVEAVVERLDAKQALLERVERHRAPHAIVSSNTSGIPIAAVMEGRSESFRAHALGTHFFNPPRYLRLLELIPTKDTDAAVMDTIGDLADRRLGKGVVVAKDTPNFIANRLGLFGVMQILRAWTSEGSEFTIDEIDTITGPALGRPKSATFRTIDLAGLDILVHVMRNLAERLTSDADRAAFVVPPVVEELLRRGWIGSKAGQGFYKKDANGEILTLDRDSLTYKPKTSTRLASLDAARSIDDAGTRIRTLFDAKDKVGRLLRDTLGPTLVYTARVSPDIAHSIDDVDRAMRWGFGWELGPFETWDAIGLEHVLEACGVTDPPPLVRDALPHGAFRPGKRLQPERGAQAPRESERGWGPASAEKGASLLFREVPPAGVGLQFLRTAKERTPVVRQNAGASLVDLGDGALAVEFHSKMNAIGGDTIQMLQAGVKEAAANFKALVVGNDAPNFSAGANLMLLLLEAQEGNWEDVDLMIRAFQGATMGLKQADVPVVVAPAGLTLGGGCEISLHGTHVQAAAETYMGLVEVGVGLIPAGGGTKEMLARATDGIPPGADLLPFVQRVFETIGFAKVSTSGPDAQRLGYLRPTDGITMNRERLIADAKSEALARAAGYVKAQPRTAIPVGGEGLQAALKLGIHLAWRGGRISDHDALIGRKLARILSGGDRPNAGTATEQELLDLEREAFLSLCGERKTLERIAHTLRTGKPLRN
jgi:3-hydroxyacyl-CoA dehydrogenase